MRNPSPETIVKAVAMKNDGESWNTILAETGLNYSQAWLPWARAQIEGTELDLSDTPVEQMGKVIAKARHEETGEHRSWGWLAVRTNQPESRVRKQYEQAANVYSTGQRISHGGRFVEDNEAFYVGDHKATGTVTAVGEQRVAPEPALNLSKYSVGQLRALMTEAGLPIPKGKGSKAEMVAQLQERAQANA